MKLGVCQRVTAVQTRRIGGFHVRVSLRMRTLESAFVTCHTLHARHLFGGLKTHSAKLLSAVVVALVAAPVAAVLEPAPSIPAPCSFSSVARAHTPASLRQLIDTCKTHPEVALEALGKLNSSAIPANLVARLRSSTGKARERSAGAEQEATHVSLEAAIYFESGESFPTDDGFQAMSELVEQVNSTGGSVKSVALVGTVDSLEAETALARSLARGRAGVVHRYLVAAGVDRSLIRAGINIRPGSATVLPSDRAAYAVLIVQLPS